MMKQSMTDPYLPELDLDEAEAAELLELLERTDERAGAAIAAAAVRPEVGNDREVLAAQLASVVAYLEHVTGFERFDKLLHLCRVGHKASFRMGIRPNAQGSA